MSGARAPLPGRVGILIGAVALVAAALVALPVELHACAVCFDARDENRQAFLATTAFLSLLPLGMVGGVGLWLRKRARESGEPSAPESGSERDAAAGRDA